MGIKLILAALLAIALFAGCITHETREIGIIGRTPLINSSINFYIINDDGSRGALAGSATSDADGTYNVILNASQNDFVLAEASNGYYASGVNRTMALKPSQMLTAVVQAENDSLLVTITPLTHMAAKRALALAGNGTPLSDAVVSSNTGVARQYGLVDIIQVQPVPADDADWVAVSDVDERGYSLVLAGMSKEADTLDVGAMDLADALAEDASDGLLDGNDNGEPITMDTLSGGSARLDPDFGTAGVQNGIAAAQVAPNMNPNQANFAIPIQPVPLGINGAGKFYITSTMPPAAFAGDVYNVQLTAQGGKPPYACSLVAKNVDLTVSASPDWLQLGQDCTLRGNVPPLVGGNTMTISQPFTVLMCDSANQCEAFEMRITIIGQKPEITTHEARCFVDEFCDQNIATAEGGTPPYYFRSDYLREGPPPMGTIVDLNGNVRGTPTVMGTYSVGVCAIDTIGAYSCGPATVNVVSHNATLYLRKTGSGTGKVYANPYNGESVYANGVTVTLTAKADSGSTFMGWGGDCGSASSGTCTLLMDGDKSVEAQFDSSGQQPSGELSVKIDSGRCGAVNGEAYGPVGTTLAVYYAGGTPASSIKCGKWTPGPDTQYQCQRGDSDPYGTGWAAVEGGGSVTATVYAPTSSVLSGGDMMKNANANFPCR